MLTVDTETRGLLYKEGVGSVFMVQWADAHGEYVCDENTGWQPFLAAIAEHDMLVLANASFDCHHLRASGIVDLLDGRWRVHDVLTLARVALPGRFRYKLEALGTDLLGADATVAQRELAEAARAHGVSWTQEDKDYYGLWKLEPELMEKYGKEDVRLTWDVWQHIYLRREPWVDAIYRMEIAEVAPVLRAAEWAGVRVHPERRDALEAKLIEERDDYRAKMLEAGISEAAIGAEIPEDDWEEDGAPEFGKASTIALREDLLALGVPLYRNTKRSGQPRLDKETGEPVRDKDGRIIRTPVTLAVNKDALMEFVERFPVVSYLMEWRSRCKTLQTYISALKRADPGIHTSFNQVAARTSRMSASNPNVQNLPRTEGVRDVLIPAPGNAFVVGDYASIEVYVLAHMIGDPDLIAKLEAGFDLYSMVAAERFGLPYEDCLKDGPGDWMRTESKTTALTATYGGGGRLIGIRLGVSTEEGQRIKAATLGAIPGFFAFEDGVKTAVLSRQFPHVKTLLGRVLHVPREKPYIALNSVIQGNAAEVLKLGMVAAARALEPFGYTVKLVVHDELVAEGPVEHAEAAMAAMVSAMEGAYPLRPALKVSASWSADSYGKAKG